MQTCQPSDPNPALQAAEIHARLGAVHRQQGRLAAAVASYRHAIRLQPTIAALHFNLGNTLWAQGDTTAAIDSYREALRLAPDLVEAHTNLGVVLQAQGQLDAAHAHYEAALHCRPDLAEAHFNLGFVHQEQGHLAAAVRAYETTVALQPDHAAAYYNLGVARHALGHASGAVTAYQAALRLQPNCARTRWSLALSWLAQGNLAEGWAAYEWRWHTLQEPQPAAVPRWDGSAVTGRTILVSTEQGVGDALLFASCLPDLVAQAGHVVWACDPRLASLFARALPEATVREMGQHDFRCLEHVPPPDVHVPVGSLLRYLRPTLAHFPPQAGYLRPDPGRCAQYQQRLATLEPGLKVGIAWRSLRTRSDVAHYPTLDQWQALLQVPGVHWINLQYDQPQEELAAVQHQWGITLHTWDDLDLMHDFEAVAALIMALDLVIAPEMTVAALAASLGQVVWRLTSAGGSWTSLGTDRCPWFPSVRVVRPPQPGQWSEVLAQLAHDVAQLAEK